MGSASRTIDHDEIRAWVEERGGKPARVKATGHGDEDPGILRIDFPGYSGEGTLEHISWDEWFEAFEANNLAFIAQAETADGHESRFSKLVTREPEDEKSSSSRSHKKTSHRAHGSSR